MDARGISARINDLDAPWRRALIGLILVAAFGVSWWSLFAPSPDLPIALWWPAAGVGFAAVLASRGRRIAVAGAITGISVVANLLGGRPLELSIAYGLANAIEVWVIVWVLTRGRRHAEFTTLKQMGRLILSISIGTSIFAVIAATAAALGAGADPYLTAFSLFSSHASALFVTAPLALVSLTVPLRAPRWEAVVQPAVFVFFTVVVFAAYPEFALTFVIITPLLWGAYRLPPIVPALQTFALALVSVTATEAALGPFGLLIAEDLRGAVIAMQVFLMTHASAGLLVAGQNADWNASTAQLASRESDATRVAVELRELNEQREQFIASVSHELRTPVTSILGFAETLSEPDQPGFDVAVAGRIIYRNARRLAEVIEDVLEVSELTTQGGNRLPAELDAVRLLTECVEDATGLVSPSRSVHVDLAAPPHAVTMIGVEQDLTRVFANLLSNAIKFSPVDGTVTVTLSDDDEAITVRVSDEGPGIPLDEHEHVWHHFYRVQSPRHSSVPGTGLGLPIVRALVHQRIGGSIELVSDGEHGTTMVVRAPRWRMSQGRPGLASVDNPST